MIQAPPHPEEIKATIRMRFGSLKHFEEAKDLKERSVTDVLRGKLSRKTAEAIADELGLSVHEVFPDRYQPANADCSNAAASMHRQNAGAK